MRPIEFNTMKTSICTYGFIPVRKQPEEQAEMVTQLLFGEAFTILQAEEKWSRIQSHFDHYKGWIDSKLIDHLPATLVEKWENADKWIAPGPFIKVICEADNSTLFVPGGSAIYFNCQDRNCFQMGYRQYYLSGNYPIDKPTGSINEISKSFINTPYLWGGRNFYGIDCSGFVQIVYKIAGYQLPRDASQQVNLGQNVSFVEEAQAGDLAFFDNAEGHITHVGLCLGKGQIIHASGRVRIDKLDHQGIFDNDRKSYSHKLRIIKRVIE